MDVSEIVKRAKELEIELDELKQQYLRTAAPCENKDCSFYDEFDPLNCSWTNWVTECPMYICEGK